MICPACQGAKKIYGVACRGGEHKNCRLGLHPCYVCHETGEIPDEAPLWRRLGVQLREIRQRRGVTMGQLARYLGIKVTDVSDQEMGRVEPSLSTGRVIEACREIRTRLRAGEEV